jgi:D-alanyl-D-alanine carboxypeptidase
MMLPSGNDAASLLAFYYGYWLDKEGTFPNLVFRKSRKVDLKDKLKYCNLLTKRFMQYLNDKIIKSELNHKNTRLENPHGLSNKFQVFSLFKQRYQQHGK